MEIINTKNDIIIILEKNTFETEKLKKIISTISEKLKINEVKICQ